jgi:hypothetical protein
VIALDFHEELVGLFGEFGHQFLLSTSELEIARSPHSRSSVSRSRRST